MGSTPRYASAQPTYPRWLPDDYRYLGTAGEPRPEDRTDTLSFDPADPAGPYTLTQPPYPGPRRAWLLTETGDGVPLRASEIVWDRTEARNFSLALLPHRDVSAFSGVRVLYGVTAVHTRIKATQTLGLQLKASDASSLERAEALVAAVIQLNRQRLIDDARASYEDGEYGAAVELKNVSLAGGTRPADFRRSSSSRQVARSGRTKASRSSAYARRGGCWIRRPACGYLYRRGSVGYYPQESCSRDSPLSAHQP